MRRLLKEPLIHFLLIGAVLFAGYRFLHPERGPAVSSREIQLSLDDLSQLAVLFQSQWKRDPTPEEIERLVEQKVQSEVLYREALALGLEKNDEIVKRRMAQKMQFLAEDVAAAREPSLEELKAWHGQHPEIFALPKRLSFRHLYFSPDQRGTRARADAGALLPRLAGQPEDVRLPESSSDPFMFQEYYRDRAPDYLGKEFGPPFAAALQKLPEHSWQGPIESGFGWHLVYVDTVVPGRVPAFEEIETEVRTAWLAEQKAQAWEKSYREMRAKYTVLLPRVPKDASNSPPASPIPASSATRAAQKTRP